MRTASARSRSVRTVALTGTPGTGKSAVARRIARRWPAVEVADLALALGAGRKRGRSVIVDLPRLRARWGRWRPEGSVRLVVGHLAHLLPVREVVILRCHPIELVRRLRAAHRGTARERGENFAAEALDVVLQEAVGGGRVVCEVDTTGRPVADVAREVERLIDRHPRSKLGRVDWLADPLVTEQLLLRDP